MTTTPDPEAHPTAYTVSCLPLDHPEHYHFAINVEWRGPGDRWAVCHSMSCLGANGMWGYEPSNSNRTDEWKATHRFPLDQALALAKEQAPKMTLRARGRVLTVDDVLAKEQAR